MMLDRIFWRAAVAALCLAAAAPASAQDWVKLQNRVCVRAASLPVGLRTPVEMEQTLRMFPEMLGTLSWHDHLVRRVGREGPLCCPGRWGGA